METIEFSVFDHGSNQTAILRQLLKQFEVQERIKVNLEVYPWTGAWSRMVQIALYKDGPDLSEMGSSWIGDFVHMNALRPFSQFDIRNLGGQPAFLAPAWQSAGTLAGYPAAFTLWGAPWLTDARVIVYRQDLYEQAGVDPQTAFHNPDQLEDSLERLMTAGVAVPLVLPTLRSRIDLHVMASWVWAEGGRFVSDDGAEILFDQPQAMRGLIRYFGLARFLVPEARGLNDDATFDSFFNGRAATAVGGHWTLADERVLTSLQGKVKVSGLLSASYVGGSHLVIWDHSMKNDAALKLVDFLAGQRTPADLYPGFGFPARHDALQDAAFMQDPNHYAMVQAALQGRTFTTGRLWGMIEKRLVDVIPLIWQQVLESDPAQVGAIVEKFIPTLAQRIRYALKS